MKRTERAAVVAALGAAFGVPAIGHAEPRPDEGGLWAFADEDVLERFETEDGSVSVHYSVVGPNVTRLEDRDGSGIPDYVEEVASTAQLSLEFFREDLGFEPPTPETEVGEALGGSEALDVYLVDFGGAADGRFGLDDCNADGACAGFVVLENDFAGYGYPSIQVAIDIVVSHELFHAVQASYAALPVWMSEGTATWATHRFDARLPDFVSACGGYLADPGRPLFSPPPGPVPAFAYGTALWWEYITRRNSDEVVGAVLTGVRDAPTLPAQEVLADALAEFDDSVAEAWPMFVQHNLATGFRAGAIVGHPYAGELPAIVAAAEGPTLDLEARLFPVAAEYWRVEHAGGALFAGTDAALADSIASLHPIAGFEPDGVVGDAIASWDMDVEGSVLWVDDLPAGGYWIVATQAAVAEASARGRVCVGPQAHVAGCGIEPVDDAEGSTDGGGSEEGPDDGLDTGTATGPASSSDGATGEGDTDATAAGTMTGDADGCSCSTPGASPLRWGWLGLLFARRRRCC